MVAHRYQPKEIIFLSDSCFLSLFSYIFLKKLKKKFFLILFFLKDNFYLFSFDIFSRSYFLILIFFSFEIVSKFLFSIIIKKNKSFLFFLFFFQNDFTSFDVAQRYHYQLSSWITSCIPALIYLSRIILESFDPDRWPRSLCSCIL